MHFITLDSETDFEGWRKAARGLVLHHVPPSEVTWSVQGHEPELFELPAATLPLEAQHSTFNVPAKFVELAQSAILHRDPERFAILYRLLWRLRRNHELLSLATDPEMSRAQTMAKAVHRDQHRMEASVRFREIGREQKARFIAWFEPEHHIVEATSPFFARRFADMRGRSSPRMSARIGTAMSSPSRRASARPTRLAKTGWRKPGCVIMPASSTRPGCPCRRRRRNIGGTCRRLRRLSLRSPATPVPQPKRRNRKNVRNTR
jgi:hypothetical protein